jgi:hypothetical protein
MTWPSTTPDPVLGQLVHAVNESGQARVPLTVSAHGTVGALAAATAEEDKGPFARLLGA